MQHSKEDTLLLIVILVFALGILSSFAYLAYYLVAQLDRHGSWIYADVIAFLVASIFFGFYFYHQKGVWPLLVSALVMFADYAVSVIQNAVMNPPSLIDGRFFPDNALFFYWLAVAVFITIVFIRERCHSHNS
jgi:hypothetical protein